MTTEGTYPHVVGGEQPPSRLPSWRSGVPAAVLGAFAGHLLVVAAGSSWGVEGPAVALALSPSLAASALAGMRLVQLWTAIPAALARCDVHASGALQAVRRAARGALLRVLVDTAAVFGFSLVAASFVVLSVVPASTADAVRGLIAVAVLVAAAVALPCVASVAAAPDRTLARTL